MTLAQLDLCDILPSIFQFLLVLNLFLSPTPSTFKFLLKCSGFHSTSLLKYFPYSPVLGSSQPAPPTSLADIFLCLSLSHTFNSNQMVSLLPQEHTFHSLTSGPLLLPRVLGRYSFLSLFIGTQATLNTQLKQPFLSEPFHLYST